MRRTCGSVRKSLSSWPARALFCRPAAAGAGIGKGGRGRAHTERGHEVVVHQTDQVARASARRQPERESRPESPSEASARACMLLARLPPAVAAASLRVGKTCKGVGKSWCLHDSAAPRSRRACASRFGVY